MSFLEFFEPLDFAIVSSSKNVKSTYLLGLFFHSLPKNNKPIDWENALSYEIIINPFMFVNCRW